MAPINIGTAGWTIPRPNGDRFPAHGSALERYSTVLSVVEINSSFHRPHRRTTWERWRDSVPEGFRFSVKLPKQITHELKLVDCSQILDHFMEQAGGLGEKLAVLLVQLPPKLGFDEQVANHFFAEVQARSSSLVACEPRHLSWFTPAADAALSRLGVARVAADPAICEEAASPGGWKGLSYRRLHGSPIIYRSSYHDRITTYAAALKRDANAVRQVWCILDNTASSAAMSDALELMGASHCTSGRRSIEASGK